MLGRLARGVAATALRARVAGGGVSGRPAGVTVRGLAQFGDAEGDVEGHFVDDKSRAANFKKVFAELQEIEHVQLVDCSPMALYQRAHMLGAVPLGEHQRRMKSSRASTHVMTRGEMESLMESLKVGPDTFVFAYDSDNGLFASRFVWALWYYGHSNAYVPSGGWSEWIRQHQPIGFGSGSLEAHAEEEKPAKRWVAHKQDHLLAVADDLDDPMVQVIDVRSEAEYVGTATQGNPRGGHIPGARHLDWRQLCDREHPEYLKLPEEREEVLATIGGLDRTRPVVTVCQSGLRSAFAAIALADLGYHVANYDASMEEWLADESRPVHTGHPN